MMEKNLKSSSSDQEKKFLDLLNHYKEKGLLPQKVVLLLEGFFVTFKSAIESQKKEMEIYMPLFFDYLDLIRKQVQTPYLFPSYHQKVLSPYNYHEFGINFIKPLVYEDQSYLLGEEHLAEIENHIKDGHNVVFLANHQIEPDPQAIFILLEPKWKSLIDPLIFVAGERVVIDPIAVPFSLGCNLLCIYSKRYIDTPADKKEEKQLHNAKTMKVMKSLLDEGSHLIYVAPSGGRDRIDSNGVLLPAIFDPQSIEMFYLMAKHSKKPTFFYPLALSTYSILPPPETIQKELGEVRNAKASAIKMSVGKVIDFDNDVHHTSEDKNMKRVARSDHAYNLVCKEYERLV